MSRYTDEAGYDVGVQFPTTKPGLTPSQVAKMQTALNEAPTREITYPSLTVNQDNFPLADGDFHRFTSSGVAITGFRNARGGLQVILNADTVNNLTLANNSGSSLVAYRILCHTGADIVLNPNESALIRYDFSSLRWRTIGFV